MVKLGNKSQVAGAEHWPTFTVWRNPTKMPKLPEGHTVVCGIEQEGDEEEQMFICETPEQMQLLHHEYISGHATRIKWYHTGALNNAVVIA